MKLILPVAGSSTRYPGMKPKWLLTHPNGNLMFHEAIAGLDIEAVEEILLVCRQDHFKEFGVEEAVGRQFSISAIKKPWRIFPVEPTRSQPETVARAIQGLNLSGPIFVKDSDNYYRYRVAPGNRVATMNLNALAYVDAASKSYVELDRSGKIANIVEKHVISNTFCVGGYGFAEAEQFLEHYSRISAQENLYVSHVIYNMLLKGTVFDNDPVTDFVDWGTLRDWNRFKRQFATLFIDLDGTIVKNSGFFFTPSWGETEAIPETVTALNKLFDSGKIQVIITTSRAPSFRGVTEAQLKRFGVKYHQIIYGLPHSRRILINDYTDTNPYKAADAINIPRNSPELGSMLRDFFETLN